MFDKYKLKTPMGQIFRVQSEALAIAVATEWDSQQEFIRKPTMYLVSSFCLLFSCHSHWLQCNAVAKYGPCYNNSVSHTSDLCQNGSTNRQTLFIINHSSFHISNIMTKFPQVTLYSIVEQTSKIWCKNINTFLRICGFHIGGVLFWCTLYISGTL